MLTTVLISPLFCSARSLTISLFLYFEYLSYSVDILSNQSLLASAVSAWSWFRKRPQNPNSTAAIIFCYLRCTYVDFWAIKDASVRSLAVILKKKTETSNHIHVHDTQFCFLPLFPWAYSIFLPYNHDKRKLQHWEKANLRYWFLWFSILYLCSLLWGLLSPDTDTTLQTPWPACSLSISPSSSMCIRNISTQVKWVTLL